jgi:hypothetical protein
MKSIVATMMSALPIVPVGRRKEGEVEFGQIAFERAARAIH